MDNKQSNRKCKKCGCKLLGQIVASIDVSNILRTLQTNEKFVPPVAYSKVVETKSWKCPFCNTQNE